MQKRFGSHECYSQENSRQLVHIHEGTRTKNKFCLRNSLKIGRGGTKELGWSIWYQEIGQHDGVLEDRILCVSVANLYLMCHFTGSQRSS